MLQIVTSHHSQDTQLIQRQPEQVHFQAAERLPHSHPIAMRYYWGYHGNTEAMGINVYNYHLVI